MSDNSICSVSAVFHYTSLASLDTILKEDGVKLWATRYGFLNDKREFVWANQVIKPELEKIAKQNGETYDPEHQVHPYIVSFCDAEDDLTMWRLYGNDGKGVCLTFDINEMDIRFENFMAHMSVVYANENNIRESIELAHNIYQQDYANTRIADNYREVSAFVKHKDYEIEQEYRIVKFVCDGFSCKYDSTKKDFCKINDFTECSEDIKFRIRGNVLVPYVELTFPKVSLKKISIGYDCDYDDTKRLIEHLNNRRGYNAEIIKSSINNFIEK